MSTEPRKDATTYILTINVYDGITPGRTGRSQSIWSKSLEFKILFISL
jgi:hypothetical protein